MGAIKLSEKEVVKKAGLDYDKLQEVLIEHLMDKRNWELAEDQSQNFFFLLNFLTRVSNWVKFLLNV